MKKPELVIRAAPSGEPLLRGFCSSCPDVTFFFVGDIEENRRLMQQMFDKHFKTVHLREDHNSFLSQPIPRLE
jgi:hypothetical protein